MKRRRPSPPKKTVIPSFVCLFLLGSIALFVQLLFVENKPDTFFVGIYLKGGVKRFSVSGEYSFHFLGFAFTQIFILFGGGKSSSD